MKRQNKELNCNGWPCNQQCIHD